MGPYGMIEIIASHVDIFELFHARIQLIINFICVSQDIRAVVIL